MNLRRGIFSIALIMLIAVAAYAGNLNTSGKCPRFAGCVLGDSTTTSLTIVTDGSGTGEVVLPPLSISGSEIAAGAIAVSKLAENAVAADALAAISDKITLCGDDANDGTIYFGPATAAYLGGGGEHAIGGTACDALDSATEGTADAPIHAGFPSFKVTGMVCISSTDAANDQVLTLRSAEADVNPSVTCTIAGTGSAVSCSTITATTTDIAAGATIAVKSVNTEDLSGADVRCEVYFSAKAL